MSSNKKVSLYCDGVNPNDVGLTPCIECQERFMRRCNPLFYNGLVEDDLSAPDCWIPDVILDKCLVWNNCPKLEVE